MFGRIFILLFLLSACSKNENYEQIKVLGHAATGLNILNSVYHDNSKEAIEFALSIEGCEGVEIDIQLSKDGKLWLYHNENLSSETNGDGCIGDLNSNELASLSYTTLVKEKLVSLDQIDFGMFKGKELFLDFRHLNSCTGSYASVQKVIDELTELNLNNPEEFKVNCLVSYSTWIDPLISAGFSVYYSIYSSQQFEQAENQFPLVEGYVVKNKDFNSNEIQKIQDDSKKVYIFEIRSPKGIRSALRKNPNGVITDDIRATLIEKY